MLRLSRRRPMKAGELADQFCESWPTLSVHFKILRETNLVHAEKRDSTIT
ncbi:MAG: helix-turn-helix domain-containing protein [Pseudomonadota bacterium]